MFCLSARSHLYLQSAFRPGARSLLCCAALYVKLAFRLDVSSPSIGGTYDLADERLPCSDCKGDPSVSGSAYFEVVQSDWPGSLVNQTSQPPGWSTGFVRQIAQWDWSSSLINQIVQ